jgi:hypothetical protein
MPMVEVSNGGTGSKTIAMYMRAYSSSSSYYYKLIKIDYDNSTYQARSGSGELDEFRISGNSLYATKTGTYAKFRPNDALCTFITCNAGDRLMVSSTDTAMWCWVFCHE